MKDVATRANYAVLLRCPHRDEETWVILQDRTETVEQILETPWDFECSIHGVQREMPIAAKEKERISSSAQPAPKLKVVKPAAAAAGAATGANKRGSPRQYLKTPVQVYGWVRSKGAFHEETNTIVVNAGGCLVSMDTRVAIGDQLFVVNRVSGRELQVRVVYVQPEGIGAKVGLAFKNPVPGFWHVHRGKPRVPKALKVLVRGVDKWGNEFTQDSYTVDISEKGARLQGIGGVLGQGVTVEVKHGWRKAKYRVVWIGPAGTPQANQIGIVCVDDKNIWGGELPANVKNHG